MKAPNKIFVLLLQAAVRKRESIRLKLQMGSAPGMLEKEIQNKIRIEESVCQGTAK